MPTSIDELLLNSFTEIASGGTSGAGDVSRLTDGLVDAMRTAVTEAGSAVASSVQNGGTSGGGSLGMTVLKSGLGLTPLLRGLIGLFGGGGTEEPPALTKYAAPARISLNAADTAWGLTGSDYDQTGMPRAVGGAAPERGAASQATPITVNIQAMDARSFLDRSSDIAAAVREAMLNLNSINDVVNDL